MTKRLFALLALWLGFFPLQAQTISEPIVLGYFPSWSETWTSTNQNSILREIPPFVNYVFLSFAKPDLTYVAGSYDIGLTGINVPYDGCTLKESVSALNDKGIEVILSVGGETYWGDPNVYNNINYQQIKDLVDDMGFVGVDWDYEPNGSFANIGSATNVQHFIDFITNTRAVMPADSGYIVACAPSGVGALGGQTNDDASSPYRYNQRNTLTGETDANLYNGAAVTNGINLFGFSATGHMIPVLQAVGDTIDIVAYQGYNCGGSTNREIMYDSYAHYAELYGFTVAAGVHYPDEPWGPYYMYTHANVASLSQHVRDYPTRVGDNDGIMIWQLLMTGSGSSAYSYMHIADEVLNGGTQSAAIANANNFSMAPYTGGATGCTNGGGGGGGSTYCGAQVYDINTSYPTAGTQVYHDCKVWSNQWWANPGEAPGSDAVWVELSLCGTGPGCGGSCIPTYATYPVTSCGPYTWTDGNTYGSSNNTATDTLLNSQGCDSVVMLNLTIAQATSSSQNVSTCGSYQWQGTTYVASGQYTQTIQNSVGCDSVMTLHLTLGQSSTSTSNINSCGPYQWQGSTYSASGLYTHTIQNSAGCDSVMTLNLTVGQHSSSTSNINSCGPYQWQGSTYNASGLYTHTIQNSAGCDSVMTLNLTVGQATSSSSTVTACNSYQWQGSTYSSSGQFTQIIPNSAGCDSVMTLNLTIQSGPSSNTSASSCDSYSWNGNTYSTTGNYNVTFPLGGGCDSVAHLNLTILSSTSSQTVETACDEYLWQGNLYTASGTYQQTIPNAVGCDSVMTLQLTLQTIDPTVSTTGFTITSNQANASYQWLDCASNTPIAGATNGSYTATENGSYAVVVTLGNCVDTSSCENITGVGISAQTLAGIIRAYPNPTRENVQIDLGRTYDEISIVVRDITARVVGQYELRGVASTSLPLPDPSALYLIEVQLANGERAVLRVMKE